MAKNKMVWRCGGATTLQECSGHKSGWLHFQRLSILNNVASSAFQWAIVLGGGVINYLQQVSYLVIYSIFYLILEFTHGIVMLYSYICSCLIMRRKSICPFSFCYFLLLLYSLTWNTTQKISIRRRITQNNTFPT